MRRLILSTLLFVFGTSCNSGGGEAAVVVGPTWQSIQLGVSPGIVNFYDLATDSSGNIYVAGSTSGTLANAPTGSLDVMVRKYNSLGEHQWTKQWGVTGALSSLNSIALDNSGNIFVGGLTDGDLSGDGLNGVSDAYVAMLDNEGTLVWDLQLGDSTHHAGTATVNAVTVDTLGNVYFAGDFTDRFMGQAALGPKAAFMISRNSDGTARWNTSLPFSGATTTANGIAWCDTTNKIYVVGASHQIFPGGIATSEAAYILSMTDAGVSENILSLTTTSLSFGLDVAVSGSGDIYVAGVSVGDINGVTVPSSTSGSAFLVKYDSSLSDIWTAFVGQGAVPGPDVASIFRRIILDADENIIAAGTATGEITGHNSVSDGAFEDVLVAKFSAAGSLLWSEQYGTSTQAINSVGVAVGTSGNPFVSGVTLGDFDGNTAVGSGNNGVVFQLDKTDGALQ